VWVGVWVCEVGYPLYGKKSFMMLMQLEIDTKIKAAKESNVFLNGK
jgi:hypothetical protein